MQRFLATLLILAGLGSIGYGVATATVLRESDTVVATATPSGDGTMVVTEPGVLGLVDDQVTVRATVPEGQKVTLALGSDVDVLGWVGKDPYDSVTGLSSWEELTVVPGTGLADDAAAAEGDEEEAPDEPAEKPDSGPDPAGSDMWLSEVSGETTVSMRWTEEPGRVVLLAAGVGEDAQAPTLELTWPRSVATPFLWPGVLGGSLLLILGVFMAVGASRKRRGGGGKGRSSSAGARQPASEPTGRDAVFEVDGGQPSPAEPGGELSPPPSVPSDGRTAAFPPAPATSGRGRPGPGRPAPGRPVREPVPADGVPAPFGGAAPITPVPAPEPAPEPVAAPAAPARGLRRGRRGQSPTPAPSGGAVPEPAAQAEAKVPGEAAPTASGKPMTRRELRMREQAQRRAATGTMPAVPVPDPVPDPAPEPDETPSSRAAAWRQTWGVTGDDGGNR